MNKAILLLNKKPSHCGVCPLKIYNYNLKDNSATVFCCAEPVPQYREHTDIYKYWHKARKPKWCPLKPMPKKRKLPELYKDNYELKAEIKGWNDCIDEIIGEEK